MTLTKHLSNPKVRYLFVGGGVYVFELAVIVLAERSGSSPELAVAISFSAGTAVSFLLQKFVTFGDARTHHRVVLSQALAVGGLIVFNLAFSVLLTALLENLVPAVVSRTLALAITTLWNFYFYKFHIFNGGQR